MFTAHVYLNRALTIALLIALGYVAITNTQLKTHGEEIVIRVGHPEFELDQKKLQQAGLEVMAARLPIPMRGGR